MAWRCTFAQPANRPLASPRHWWQLLSDKGHMTLDSVSSCGSVSCPKTPKNGVDVNGEA